MKRLFQSVLIVALSTLALTSLGLTSAIGHAGVISTSPTQGEKLALMPTQIAINFSENLLELGERKVNTISLFYGGEKVVIGDAIVSGSRLTALLSGGDFPEGSYEVRYRVISADGHEVADAFTFSIASNSAPSPDTSPDSSPAAPPVESDGNSSEVALPLLLAAIALLATLGFLIFERRRRAR